LSATLNATGDQVQLLWSVDDYRADGYAVERSQTRTGGYSQVLAVSGNQTSAIDNPGSASGSYFYRVRSFKSVRSRTLYSPYSNVAEVSVISEIPVPDTDPTTPADPSTPAAYPAPVLNDVTLSGSSFVVSWSMPNNPYGTPSGGYDLIIDGVDTGSAWRTTATKQTVTGLEAGVKHTFKVQARWLQAEPDQTPESNELSAQIAVQPAGDTAAPSVSITSPSASTTVTKEQTLTIVASASDNVGVTKVEFYRGSTLIGTDTTNTFSTTLALTSADNGTLGFTAVAYDAAGNTTRSDAVNVTVNIADTVAAYPAPVLNDVTVSGSSFVLSWSMPSNPYGTPSGGYDLIIDGVDTGTAWRTTATKQTVTGLTAGVKHTFRVQARWLQAEPDQTPESNELSGIFVDGSDSSTDSGSDTTNPPNNDTYTPPADGILRVFPGAEGFGTQTKAGRGGKIIHVTNLNDSGTGSLRAALQDPNPRIIVFDVGGVIKLNSDLSISSPYVTLAGQTAPGDGIMIRNYGVRISTHDVLIQHLAIRVGDDGRSATGAYDNLDCLQILSGYNIVIDHVSASWGIDENMSVWGSNVRDLTFSHCLIAEGLQNSAHTEGRHSKGLLIGGNGNNPKNVAIIKNLFAHNHERNPQLKGGVTAVVANNLVYNSNNEYSWFVTSRDKVEETNKGYYVGNIGKDGPNSLSATFIKISSSILPGSQIFQEDNMQVSRSSATFKDGAGVMVNSPPITFSPHNIMAPYDAMYYVLANAGSRPAYRDAVDNRIANPSSGEIVRGTGTIRDHSAGLWPTYSTTTLAFNTGANPNGDDDGDGYTNIEELLHQAAARVEGR
jgi:hypothetical protein